MHPNGDVSHRPAAHRSRARLDPRDRKPERSRSPGPRSFPGAVPAARPGRFGRLLLRISSLPISSKILSADSPGYDVFDVEWEYRQIGLVQATIFTALPGARADQFAKGILHAGWPRRASRI